MVHTVPSVGVDMRAFSGGVLRYFAGQKLQWSSGSRRASGWACFGRALDIGFAARPGTTHASVPENGLTIFTVPSGIR